MDSEPSYTPLECSRAKGGAAVEPPRTLLTRIDLYLLKETALPFIVALSAVTVLVFVFQVRKLATSALGLGLSLEDALMIVAAALPPFVVLALPMAYLLSVLVALGRLGEDRELFALFAAGASPLRLARVPVLLGAVVTLASLPISLWAEPAGMRTLHDRLVTVGLKNLAQAIRPGVFNEDFAQSAVYAEGVSSDGTLENVLVFDARTPEEPVIVLAQRGRILRHHQNLTFSLHEGELHRFDPQNGDRYDRLRFERGRLALDADRELKERTQILSGLLMRPTFGLLQEADEKQNSDPPLSRRMVKTFWRRFSVPTMAWVFAVLGSAIGLRYRTHSRARSALWGLMSVLVYYLATRVADVLIVRYPGTPFLAVWLPNLILLVVGFGLLIRADQPQ